MRPSLRRRRKPRTLVAKAIRAWTWMRFGLWLMRLATRARRAAGIAVVAGLVGLGRALLRRRRRRSQTTAPATYSPPPASPPGWSGGTRETGYEAGPGTQTERELEAEKGGDGAPAQAEEPPPVEQEPPTKT